MATSLGGESPPSRQQQDSSRLESSQHPLTWQQQQRCKCVCHSHCSSRRRNSDTKRPSTAVGWSQQPQSSLIYPRVRPATAIGWEDKKDVGKRLRERNWEVFATEEEEESDGNRGVMGGGHSSSNENSNSSRFPHTSSRQGPSFLSVIQSKKKEKDKFKHLMALLIKGSSSINNLEEDDMTPLHHAVLNGEELCVKALVAFGANINAKNVFQQTPLDIATDNQREHLIPLLVSIGCVCGREIPSTLPASSSSPHYSATRRRTVSSPHELPGCRKNSSPSPAQRRKSEHKFDFGACPCEEGMTRTYSDLSEQMECHMDQRLQETMSLKPDEAFALALQKQEIARFRSKCSPSRSHPPTPLAPRPLITMATGGEGGRPQRILSLDGGGIRGLIQIDVLCEIERLTGKRITELFDWIIGTSTGGIVALALVYKQMSLCRLRDLYFRLKEDIFSKGRVGFCYDSARLEQLLKEELGTELKMDDVTHPKVLVCAVDKSNIPLKLHYFNNCFKDEFSHQLIWKVARYTTAAPMYFTECDNYVDGGVLANNPCTHGLAKIQSFHREREEPFPVACMVSVGSGLYPSQELGSVDFHVFLRLKFSGMFRKAQSLIAMLSSAIGESEALADRCRDSCKIQNIKFFRFNPNLPEKIDPGVTDNLKLLEMMITARIYMYTQTSQLHQLLPRLQQE